MEAFKCGTLLKELVGSYPDAKTIQNVAKEGGEAARLAIARLWLSEGIPYAFKECPWLYESLRSWIAMRLNVNAKEISITGSARLGQSLSPRQIGKPFNKESDLDIFIVSIELFTKLRDDFNKWSFDFESEIISPSNDRERGFWEDNYSRGAKILSKGFIDSKLIPNYDKYETVKNISQSMWLIKEKLTITPNAPTISYASVRCYKSWDDYVRQASLSLI